MSDERGITLIELLVATAITAVLMTVIAGAMVTGLRTTDATRETVQETQDAQIVSAEFTADVQSAAVVSLANTSCAGAEPVIHLGWTDDGSSVAVAYRVRDVGSRRVLTRYQCIDGGAPVSRDIANVLHVSTEPVVACSPADCGSDPRTVSLTVTESSGWSYTVTAQRRLS